MAGCSVTLSNLAELAALSSNETPSVTNLSAAFKASNPHIEFFDSDTHGYNVIEEVTPTQLTRGMKAVNTIKVDGALLNTMRVSRVPLGEVAIVQSPV